MQLSLSHLGLSQEKSKAQKLMPNTQTLFNKSFQKDEAVMQKPHKSPNTPQ